MVRVLCCCVGAPLRLHACGAEEALPDAEVELDDLRRPLRKRCCAFCACRACCARCDCCASAYNGV